MSSATSIDPEIPAHAGGAREAGAAGRAGAHGRDAFRPWHFFVLLSLLAATAAVLLTRGSRPEHLVMISLLVGAAGFAAAAFYRTLVPLVAVGQNPIERRLTESVRAGLEREKLLVLRAIKELEFDRAMGKVSPKDFEEMAGRLRSRALTLMRELEDGAGAAYRELIERELSARLSTSRRAAHPARPVVEAAAKACACGTANDPDAAFCKRCGTALGGATAS